MTSKLPFILAISGASGSIYGMRMLQYLVEIKQPVELLISRGARQVFAEELGMSLGSDPLADIFSYLSLPTSDAAACVKMHRLDDFAASVSSGSYRTCGMAIVPCSLGTLGGLAAGLTDNLIQRAALVCLKERRTLVLVVREMPFGQIQLKNMLTLSEAGAVISSASPGFYHKPETISDMIDFVVGKTLDQFGFDHSLFKRWKEEARPLPHLPR